MEKITTGDGSETLFSLKFQETYHSKSGAIEEAMEKFVVPCKIAEKAKNQKAVLLDICFGLGYNTAVALDVIKKNNPNCEVEIFALENDEEVLKNLLLLSPKIESFPLIKKMVSEFLETKKTVKKENVTFHLFLEDALDSIKKIEKNTVDAVFLDPFSPKVCPELWSQAFFEDIRKAMKDNAILATYSCARVVRDNLKAAGFRTEDGPCVGRRAPSTIGYPIVHPSDELYTEVAQ
ncbi:hypothetical protein J4457_02985 [Candidatus Woesearchaeota archaeon]|nr:hypothetical protein [Candidatus Woesearchaeota archaeon]